MATIQDFIGPENGRVLVKCRDGKIVGVRTLKDDEHVSTLKALIELAKKAGYTIVLTSQN